MLAEYTELAKHLNGRDIAELRLEALRDAHENSYSSEANPYEVGTFAAAVYNDACAKAKRPKTVNGN